MNIQYFEQLYGKKNPEWHIFHDEVRDKLPIFQNDLSHDNELYNKCPTKREVEKTIDKKKNRKDK